MHKRLAATDFDDRLVAVTDQLATDLRWNSNSSVVDHQRDWWVCRKITDLPLQQKAFIVLIVLKVFPSWCKMEALQKRQDIYSTHVMTFKSFNPIKGANQSPFICNQTLWTSYNDVSKQLQKGHRLISWLHAKTIPDCPAAYRQLASDWLAIISVKDFAMATEAARQLQIK